MKFLVVKLKDADLFYNENSEWGDHLSKTPLLLNQRDANLVIRYFTKPYSPETDQFYNPELLEIKEVEITLK